MLTLMAKLTLQNQQQMRLAMGILSDTVLLPLDTHIEKALTTEISLIQAEAAKRRQETTLAGNSSGRPAPIGPPARALALALCEGLLLMDLGSASGEAVQE